MPYIKKKELDPLVKLLRAYGLNTGEPLSKILGCSIPTAIKRIKNPELLTVGDLYRINLRGHIPIEEIRAAIKG